MFQEFQKLRTLLESRQGYATVIVTHQNADPDAVGCAFILQKIFSSFGIKAEVCLPGGPDRHAGRMLSALELPWKEECDQADMLLVCDTSNESMLGGASRLIENVGEILIIDHHRPPGNLTGKATLSLVFDEPASTVIAVLLADFMGVNLDSRASTLALAGILYDTRRYLVVSPNTFQASKILLESGGEYDKALRLLESPQDRSEIIAKLKGVQRASIIDVCGYLVAVTEASAHEATVANALISLGADLAIVAGGREVSRASIRVSKRLLEKGFDSSKLVSDAASLVGAEAGGHPGASGLSKYVLGRKLSSMKNEELRALLLLSIRMIENICREER